jgi:hypothetical protein
VPDMLFSPGPSDNRQQEHHRYRILRKGSRYNILGPEGRIFTKYKSASVAGPRWEELTHTPWPYASSAYESGQRLWELELIDREQVGKRTVTVQSKPQPKKPAPQSPARVGRSVSVPDTPLALPAPRIDLDEHRRVIQSLRRNPALLFDPQTRQALHHEVEYHRPDARWAQHLLELLARYDKRQRARKPARIESSAQITAHHIAWQEQHMRVAVGQ